MGGSWDFRLRRRPRYYIYLLYGDVDFQVDSLEVLPQGDFWTLRGHPSPVRVFPFFSHTVQHFLFSSDSVVFRPKTRVLALSARYLRKLTNVPVLTRVFANNFIGTSLIGFNAVCFLYEDDLNPSNLPKSYLTQQELR